MVFLLRWLWPCFVFIYPLAFVPWERNVLGSNYNFHVGLTVVFLLVGGLLEWFSNPQLSLGDFRRFPSYLWKNKAVLLALLLGVWAVVAAFFAAEPTFALMGTLPQDGGGALHILALSLVFCSIYSRAQRDPTLLERLIWAMLLSGVVLAAVAVLETLTRHGWVYPLDYGLFPKVTLPQRGHFAGFLTVSLALALGLWLKKYQWTGLALFLTSFSIALTLTRTAILTEIVAAGIALWLTRFSRQTLLGVAVMGLGLAGGIGLIQSINSSGTQSKIEKKFADGTTGETRLIYWKTAVRGILARPVLGWGAGGFDYVFPSYMSKEDQQKFIQLELGFKTLVSYIQTPGASPVFIVKDQENKTQMPAVDLWKCHNQFLDVGLRLGLPGLVLYVLLMLGTLRGLFQLKPASLALWIYHVFLFFWFVPFHTEAVVWVLMACANLENFFLTSKILSAKGLPIPSANPVRVQSRQ